MWIYRTTVAFVLLLFAVSERRGMIKSQREMNSIDLTDEFDSTKIMGYLTKDFYTCKIGSMLWAVISILISFTFVGRIFTPPISALLCIGIMVVIFHPRMLGID